MQGMITVCILLFRMDLDNNTMTRTDLFLYHRLKQENVSERAERLMDDICNRTQCEIRPLLWPSIGKFHLKGF